MSRWALLGVEVGIIRRRTSQIEYLELQVQAYKARTTILQQQLLSVLDTLDETLQNQDEALEKERTGKEVAQSRMRSLQSRIKDLERERDDCKGVVLELIAKANFISQRMRVGVICTKIAHSRHDATLVVKRTGFLEHHVVDDLADRSFGDNTFNGLVASLKSELQREREAHEQTRAHANILAAQVANRDAALEAWSQHAASAPVAFPDVGSVHRNRKGKSATRGTALDVQRDLDRAEITTLLEQTSTKNRALEQEIRILSRNVEETRQRANQLMNVPGPSNPPKPPPQATDGDGTPIGPSLPLPNPQQLLGSYTDLTGDPIPSNQAPIPSPRRRRHTITPQPQPSTSWSPRPRGRSKYATPHSPPATFPPATSSEPQSRAQSRHRLPTPGPCASASEGIVSRLSEQIYILSVEIDAFRTERAALSSVIDSQLHRGDEATVTPENFQQEASFDTFGLDGGQSFINTEAHHGTEAERPDHVAVPDDAAGDITEGGERSMEIATPLLSTLVTFPDSTTYEEHTQQENVEYNTSGGLEEEICDEADWLPSNAYAKALGLIVCYSPILHYTIHGALPSS
ncbi:hypothetical protein H0H87_006124 [Tephrocybe sp. NHM501043]|nr:hypothetical protein H0H87_006124 [Tephrocybe sp. NHM501043]